MCACSKWNFGRQRRGTGAAVGWAVGAQQQGAQPSDQTSFTFGNSNCEIPPVTSAAEVGGDPTMGAAHPLRLAGIAAKGHGGQTCSCGVGRSRGGTDPALTPRAPRNQHPEPHCPAMSLAQLLGPCPPCERIKIGRFARNTACAFAVAYISIRYIHIYTHFYKQTFFFHCIR